MEHAEQVQRVVTALQAMATDPMRGALVMTYENVADVAVGEVHILSATGTPYQQLVGMLVACMHAVVENTDITMEKLMDDMAGLIDQQGVVPDSAGPVH